MNKFFLLSITITLFVPTVASAQHEMEDVVFLKNGGILRGEIIERNGEKSLKIKTACRNVIVVGLDAVKLIQREEKPALQLFKESGYVNLTGMDILYSRGGTSVRLSTVNGYRFSSLFSAGIGIGFTAYDEPINMIPLFLDLKYKFLKANATPFVFLKGGYSFSIWADQDVQVENHRGGVTLNPGIGLQFETRNGFGWYISAGYNVDHSTFKQEGWNGSTIETADSYRRFLFGFGLSF